MTYFASAVLLVYFCSLALLALWSAHRLYLLALLRREPRLPILSNEPDPPFVTVQIPVYNEQYVIGQTLKAVAHLDYPPDRIELQVLDDSTDRTTAIIASELDDLRALGWRVSHLRRPCRTGYKAGALARGLQAARGEFLLILDADFIPPPRLVRQLLHPFGDSAMGMVQARWGHTNGGANRLTRVQALLLDAHFLIETNARARAGLFFNFHGTAALWRRSAIEAAGGWQADTLTEDLDLSYRAQLKGWRFAFLPEVVVPGELPVTLAAFKQQQARWAEGTIATARKHLPAVLRGALPFAVKLESVMHLLAHLVYPAALVVALLALPALMLRQAHGPAWLSLVELGLLALVVLPNRLFLRRAARLSGSVPPGWREIPMLMLTGVALAVSNTRAVWRGLTRRHAEFERTPKIAGETRRIDRAYVAATQRTVRWVELALACYLLIGVIVAAAVGSAAAVPAFAFLAVGFGGTAVRG